MARKAQCKVNPWQLRKVVTNENETKVTGHWSGWLAARKPTDRCRRSRKTIYAASIKIKLGEGWKDLAGSWNFCKRWGEGSKGTAGEGGLGKTTRARFGCPHVCQIGDLVVQKFCILLLRCSSFIPSSLCSVRWAVVLPYISHLPIL